MAAKIFSLCLVLFIFNIFWNCSIKSIFKNKYYWLHRT